MESTLAIDRRIIKESYVRGVLDQLTTRSRVPGTRYPVPGTRLWAN